MDRPGEQIHPWTVSFGLILGGLLAAWGWMRFSQPLADTIQVDSIVALSWIYYSLVYLPIAVLAVALSYLCHVRPWHNEAATGRWIASALACGIFGLGVAASLAWLNGGVVRGAGNEAAQQGQAMLLATGFALILFQVLAEELLFRGWLRQTLELHLGTSKAIFISSAIFVAFSFAGGRFELLAAVNLFLLGLFLGLIAQRSGGIAAPIAAHCGWNWMEDLVLGLNPNPSVGLFGSVFDLDIYSRPIWGGTEVGLAASLGTTAVLSALVLAVLQVGAKKRRAQMP